MTIDELTAALCEAVAALPTADAKIEQLNSIRSGLHQVSPLRHHPVDFVSWEKSAAVEPNTYNPNAVAPPEMALLRTSILEDGYTMPIVTFAEEQDGLKVTRIVDGFHRRECEQTTKGISDSTLGRLPCTDIRTAQQGTPDRMASTIRHNRARGTHNVELMSTIVSELVEMGKGDRWITQHLGMSLDEVLRLKQITGLASLFANREFSAAWEADVDPAEYDYR